MLLMREIAHFKAFSAYNDYLEVEIDVIEDLVEHSSVDAFPPSRHLLKMKLVVESLFLPNARQECV